MSALFLYPDNATMLLLYFVIYVEIGPVTVTTDPDEFEDKLSYLYVQVMFTSLLEQMKFTV